MEHYVLDPIYVREVPRFPDSAPVGLVLPDTISLLGLRYPDVLAVLSAINCQVSSQAQEEMVRLWRGPFVGEFAMLDWEAVERDSQVPRHAAQLVWAWCLNCADRGASPLAELEQLGHLQHRNPAMAFSAYALEPWFKWLAEVPEEGEVVQQEAEGGPPGAETEGAAGATARPRAGGTDSQTGQKESRAASRGKARGKARSTRRRPRAAKPVSEPPEGKCETGEEKPSDEAVEGGDAPAGSPAGDPAAASGGKSRRASRSARRASEGPEKASGDKAPRSSSAAPASSPPVPQTPQTSQTPQAPQVPPAAQPAQPTASLNGTLAASVQSTWTQQIDSTRKMLPEEQQRGLEIARELFKLRRRILLLGLARNGPNLGVLKFRYFRRVGTTYIRDAFARILRDRVAFSRPITFERAVAYADSLLKLDRKSFHTVLTKLFPGLATMTVTQAMVDAVYNQHSLVELQAAGTLAGHYISSAVREFEYFGFVE